MSKTSIVRAYLGVMYGGKVIGLVELHSVVRYHAAAFMRGTLCGFLLAGVLAMVGG
jgi:hypothetical protein